MAVSIDWGSFKGRYRAPLKVFFGVDTRADPCKNFAWPSFFRH